MAVAIILLLVAVGSVLFHLFSPWWWTPIATNWSYIDDTINITFWITERSSSRSSRSCLFASSAFITRREGGQPTIPKTKSSNGGSP